jgi:hypothetical protein
MSNNDINKNNNELITNEVDDTSLNSTNRSIVIPRLKSDHLK